MPEPVLNAYVKMLPRIEAEEELRMVRAMGAAWMEAPKQREYLRELQRRALGGKRQRGGSLASLEAMGVKVVMEKKEPQVA